MKPILLFFFTLSLFMNTTIQSQSDPLWVNCLSSENIADLHETETNIWIATNGGLINHEKSSGKNLYFNRGNSMIPSNDITDVVEDKDQVIWVSTSAGIASFDDGIWTRYKELKGIVRLNTDGYPFVVSNKKISFWNVDEFTSVPLPVEVQYNIIEDAQVDPLTNDIWISSWSFGVFDVLRYSNGMWTIFNHYNSALPFSSPDNAISIDEIGNIWVLASGLYIYDGATWSDTSSLIPWDSIDGNIVDITHDDQGGIIFLTYNYFNDLGCQLITIDNKGEYVIDRIPTLFPKRAHAVFNEFSLDNNSIFVGFSNVGLWQFNRSDKWDKLKISNTQFRSHNFFVTLDDADNIWLQNGTYNGNLVNSVFRVTDNKIENVSNSYPFHEDSNQGLSIMNANSNKTWALIRDTLFENSNGAWSPISVPDLEIDVDEINSYIYFDHLGDRWLLEAYQSNIYYESPSGWKSYHHSEHGAGSGKYLSKFNHPVSKDLWLSSYNGISIYDYESWSLLELKDYGFSQNYASFVVDKNQVIWGISRDTYFKVVEGDSIEFDIIVTDSTFGSGSRFNSIYCDSDNAIWLGMHGRVVKFTTETEYTIYDNLNSGIPNGTINSIIEDEKGNYWFGNSSGGLSIFNPSGLSITFLDSLHSSTQDISINFNGTSSVVYPNPAADEFTISTVSSSDDFTAQVFNLKGQLLKSINKFKSETSVSTINFRPGIYIVKISNLYDHSYTTHRLIIE